MTTANVPFDKRLRKIVRKNNALATRGVVHKMNKDGPVVAKPRMHRPRFPLKGLVLLLVVCFVFKAYVYYAVGSGVYDERLATLATGTGFERAGAWLMQIDPVTSGMVDVFQRVLG